jgi:hypothetical protein
MPVASAVHFIRSQPNLHPASQRIRQAAVDDPLDLVGAEPRAEILEVLLTPFSTLTTQGTPLGEEPRRRWFTGDDLTASQ